MELLGFLYHTRPGRILLRPLCSRRLSALCGKLLDSSVSRLLIPAFTRACHIDPSCFQMDRITSFNDFFCRKIKPELRPIDRDPSHLIAPCDGLLSVYPIQEGLVIPVKQTSFSMDRLLRDPALARHYQDGYCFVFRLCVDHYHRYCYADSGRKSANRFLPGVLHTVRPIALEQDPVFTENCREYTLIRTARFGTLLQMEVGAMLVGRICNYEGAATVTRGSEKGTFQYGGSTVILLVENAKIAPPRELLQATADGREVPVLMGQKIAGSPGRVPLS